MTDTDIRDLLAERWTPPPPAADALSRVLAIAEQAPAPQLVRRSPVRWRWAVPGALMAAGLAGLLLLTQRPDPTPVVALDDPALQSDALAHVFATDVDEEWL
jgi:anti-sigma factor RsiW